MINFILSYPNIGDGRHIYPSWGVKKKTLVWGKLVLKTVEISLVSEHQSLVKAEIEKEENEKFKNSVQF